jgi:WD40 repeat protein
VRLPDPRRSYAVLIGTYTYRSAELPDLPAVRNNLTDLAAALTDADLGGLSPERCITVSDPSDVRRVYRTLRRYATAAEDTLLVYFAGHGCKGPQNELYLTLSDTDPAELPVSALAYDDVRNLLRDSPASNRIVILDCCFSGQAIAGMSSTDEAVVGQLGIEGTYTLTSTPPNAVALAPAGARYTTFTGELLNLLHTGVPDGSEYLTFGTIYRRLRYTLSSRALPVPTQRGSGTVDFLGLTRNRAHTPLHQSPIADPVTEAEPRRRLSSAPVPRRAVLGLIGLVAVLAAASLTVIQPWRAGAGTSRPSPGRGTPSTHGDVDATPTSPVPVPADPLNGHGDVVTSVVFSPDGKLLASSAGDATIRLWDPVTGQAIGQPLTGHDKSVVDVAFSPDSKILASAGYDGTVRLWDVTTRQPIGQPLTGHSGIVDGVAFSPDGRILASAGHDGTIRLWNPDTGQLIGQPLIGHDGTVRALAFSPDGKILASAGSEDGTIRRWDPATGKPIGHPLTGHTGAVLDVAFSPDGKLMASAGFDDKTVRLWNPTTGQAVGGPLGGPTDKVWSVAFSPKADILASGSEDGKVWLWNPATGQPIDPPLTGHTGKVTTVAFSRDGVLASGSGDKTVRLWRVGS